MKRIYQALFAPCRSVEPLLWDHARGLLSSAQTEKVERHLADCSDCRREALQYAQTVKVTQAARQAEPPASQTDWRMLAQRLEPAPMRPVRRRTVPVLGGAMAMGVCILLAWTAYNRAYRATQSSSHDQPRPVAAAQEQSIHKMPQPPRAPSADETHGEQIARHTHPGKPTPRENKISIVRFTSHERASSILPKRTRTPQLAYAPKSTVPDVRQAPQPSRLILQPALLDAAPGRSLPKTTEYVLGDVLPTDNHSTERTYVVGDALSEGRPGGDAAMEATGW